MKTLVMTGGTAGIGAAAIRQFASQGFQVAFTGSRPPENVDISLRSLPNTFYFQGDAGDPQMAVRLAAETHTRFGENLADLLVVANAGINARGEQAANMRRINIDGPRYLLDAFAPDLSRNSQSRFVGVSSIVETLNVILPGDEEYHATKVALAAMVRGMADLYPDVYGIILSPGAVQTPMTENSPVYGFLLRLVAIAAVSDAALRSGLATFTKGEKNLGNTPAAIFANVLGTALSSNKISGILAKVLDKDPEMKGQKAQLLAAKAAQEASIRARMAEVLTFLDVLIPPEAVAAVLSEEFRDRRVSRGGVLEAFQAGSQSVAPIVKLFSALRTADQNTTS